MLYLNKVLVFSTYDYQALFFILLIVLTKYSLQLKYDTKQKHYMAKVSGYQFVVVTVVPLIK